VSGFAIRVAKMSEADRLAALHAASFAQSWVAAAFAELLAWPTSFALMAFSRARPAPAGEAAQEALGFILCRVAGGECEVATLAVLPEMRRQGIATALLETAVAYAREVGAATVFLEVAEDNEPARQLYARLGFEPVGRRAAYYRDRSGNATDALILRHGRQD
jgi:[ribosomal protein S18]-alanine N-acetyltransferase